MSNNRLVWLDALRLTAGVSMVALHATADPNGQPFPAWDVSDRVGPLIIRTIIYTARTELFLMISIFLLLLALGRRPRGYGATMMEQARRLLLPFAFWTVFYAFYSLIKAQEFGYFEDLIAGLQEPSTWLSFLLLGTSKYHMHFIPTLFGLLLLYPVFKLAKAHPWLGLGILVCLVVKREIDGFLWANYMGAPWFDYALRSVKIVTYAGYGLAAGALVGLWTRWGARPENGQWFGLICLSGMFLFAIKIIAMIKTLDTGTWPHGYAAGYWADFLFPALLFSGCMVLAHRTWPAAISRIAKYSFGIYLCHPIFLDLIEIALRDQGFAPLEQVLIKIVVGISATLALVLVLERARPLAWTIGLGPLPFSRRDSHRDTAHPPVHQKRSTV
ncbi:acyltransferase [Shimia ponticola]|uniref:acyltransferase n=1 Tax=Shimia ponticola TaxID=2582893 RepID=UPI00210247C3|nr:acyltransferase [Shimia ponticola]